MTDEVRSALAVLAVRTAVNVERAPGPAEKRLVLFQAFTLAHRLNPAVLEDPDAAVLNDVLRQPGPLARVLEDVWMREPS